MGTKKHHLRRNATTIQRSLVEGVQVELDITPAWWPFIHHRRHGAFVMTITELMSKIDELGIEPTSLRADHDRLVVAVAVRSGATIDNYGDTVDALRDHIAASVTIEDADYEEGRAPEIVDVADEDIDRERLEKLLRENDFVAKDPDIWTHPTLNLAVQFDERCAPGDISGVARWMSVAGEEKLGFRKIAHRIRFFQSPQQPTAGIFPSDGETAGGVLRANRQQGNAQ